MGTTMSRKDPEFQITEAQLNELQEASKKMLDDLSAQLPGKAGDGIREIMEFRTSISQETDRGAVLMSAAFLDDRLKQLIEARLVEDKKICSQAFDFNGPLGTFSSRINFSYLIGILPKNARADLHTIRAVRNQFAHYAAPLRYEDEKVASLCEKLTFHGVKDAAEPGSKFRRSVMGLLTHITIELQSAKHIEAPQNYEIKDRSEAYRVFSEIFTRITGKKYPLMHEHE